MISARAVVLATLIALPVLIYAVAGGYALWVSGSNRWIWWLVPACGLGAWVLSRLWHPSSSAESGPHHLSAPRHWTPRDRAAASVVRSYQERVEDYSVDQLYDPQFYLAQLQALAIDIGRAYDPKATDPVDRLTVPEVLAASRLAIEDLERWMLESVPGSRMLTIRLWRLLPKAPRWTQRLSHATWATAVLLNPLNITRYAASRWTWGPVSGQLASEVLATVYLRFIRQAGFYLIEMNSGRLRAGADAYRAALCEPTLPSQHDGRAPDNGSSAASPTITIVLVGQVSAGKSSLLNLIIGEAEAAVDILPSTRAVRRYRCAVGDPPVELSLLDTPGYGEEGASREQVGQIQQALGDADCVLLVMDAHVPAREPDRKTLSQLQTSYRSRPQLKPPPIVAVLTHIDLLPPPLEWSPPYNWRNPGHRKEESVRDATQYATELFGDLVAGVVPVCARADRAWGVIENLVPALVELLDDVRAVSLLRAYEARLDQKRWQTLLRQVARAGRGALGVWLDEQLNRSSQRGAEDDT